MKKLIIILGIFASAALVTGCGRTTYVRSTPNRGYYNSGYYNNGFGYYNQPYRYNRYDLGPAYGRRGDRDDFRNHGYSRGYHGRRDRF